MGVWGVERGLETKLFIRELIFFFFFSPFSPQATLRVKVQIVMWAAVFSKGTQALGLLHWNLLPALSWKMFFLCFNVQIWSLCKFLQMLGTLLSAEVSCFHFHYFLLTGANNVAYLLIRRERTVPGRLSSCIVFTRMVACSSRRGKMRMYLGGCRLYFVSKICFAIAEEMKPVWG